MRKLQLFLLLSLVFGQALAQNHTVKRLKITILSTMLAQRGLGEWGFSALIEADSVKILFDAGGREKAVLENAKELNIDLSNVPTLILSHWHGDHTNGWLPLRNALSAMDKNALAVTHVAPGFFDTRILRNGSENKKLREDSLLYVQKGGRIMEHKNFKEIFPGIYLTGLVPRKHLEKNYTVGNKRKDDSGKVVEDDIPEDMSLVIRTAKGLVLLSGCGHAGIINTMVHIQNNIQRQPLTAAIGGFHLLEKTDEQIKWTADQLRASGQRYFMGAHCTGIEPVYQLRESVGLKRGECIVGSVGDVFELEKGFITGPLTK